MDQDASGGIQGLQPESSSVNRPPGQPPSPPVIPDHTLLRCIGRGSYGVVWLARSTLGMYRAVKVVTRKSFDHQRPFDRELSGIRKFEPISRSHEGFIDVLHVGINEAEGCFYYVMELGDDCARGQDFDPEHYSPKTLAREMAARGKLPAQDCLQLGLSLAAGLAELHKRSLVHRDIKPSNIIFVNGIPKLADIGLVAGLEEARSYVGTEGFIPPEGPGTAQADIYSLGKVLYEASTGKDRQDFPELPTQWDRAADYDVFVELNEVILRACKNDPAKRYATAGDLHADLLLLTNGKSVKRLRLLERRLSALKRAAFIAGVAIIFLAFVGYQVFRELRIASESHQRQVGGNIAYGNNALASGDFTGALPYFVQALQVDKDGGERERTHRFRVSSVLAQCPKVTQMWFMGQEVDSAEISADGNKVLITPMKGSAEICDLPDGHASGQLLGTNDAIRSSAFSPDGRLVATAKGDGIVSLWNAESLKETRSLRHPKSVNCVRFSRDGTHIVTACADGAARVWNAANGNLELTLRTNASVIRFAAFSNDGKLVVTTSHDSGASVWDATDGRCVISCLPHPRWVNHAAFSPDGKRLVTACDDGKARVWDVATGAKIMPDLKHEDCVWSAEFSPDGRWILTASLDKTVRLWSAETLEPLATNPILWHGERVAHAAFSSDGGRVISTCTDGTVRVWDLAGIEREPPAIHRGFSADKRRFLAAHTNGLQVCETVSGREVSPLIAPAAGIREAKLSEDGRFVVIASGILGGSSASAPMIEVREAHSGSPVGPTVPVTNLLDQVVLALDGKHLLAFDGTNSQVWDVASGKALARVSHAKAIKSATFNRTGSQVALWGGTRVALWDPVTGKQAFPPLKCPAEITHVEFSPDGRLFVTSCSDLSLKKYSAQIWQSDTGKPAAPALKHGDGVLWASFSSDGGRIVTGGEDKLAIIWETATGRQIKILKHNDHVKMASFSGDGRWVITDCLDDTIRIWNAETGDPLTPPLQHSAGSDTAAVLAGGEMLVVANNTGDTGWLWPLLMDRRPVEDLARLARLLTGGAIVPENASESAPSESLESVWKKMRDKYPSSFSTTADEIAAWHESQAAECELGSDWFAADFHLQRLQSLRPNDGQVTQSLASVRAHLAAANESSSTLK